MKVLELVWKLKNQSKSSLYNVEWKKGSIELSLKLDGDLVGASHYVFILQERASKQRLELSAELSGSVLKVLLPTDGENLLFSEGIWDAFLQYENNGAQHTNRVSNTLTKYNEFPPIYINELEKSLSIYSTIKGNLSFKFLNQNTFLKTTAITLDEKGCLQINGSVQIPSWDVIDSGLIRKELILKTNEKQLNLPVELDEGSLDNHKWNEFQIVLNLDKENYDNILDEEGELCLKISYQHEGIIFPIAVSSKLTFNSMAQFQTSKGVKHIYLDVNENANLTLLAKIENLQAEVDSIYAEDGEILIKGQLIDRSREFERSISQDAFLLLKKRESHVEYQFPVRIENSLFQYVININQAVQDGMFSLGVWDLYLVYDYQRIRLVTRLDGIHNKQKVLSIPQQLLRQQDGKAFVIKPYYTIHEEVSILCREQIQAKSVDKVEFKNESVVLEGKLNIQFPNEHVSGTAIGNMSIKAEYGKKYDVSVLWKLQKIEKTQQTFQFTCFINLEENGLVGLEREILKNINFDLIDCTIKFGESYSLFSILVDPAKVVVTLEDKLKHKDMFKNRVQKWRARFYKVCNKILPVNRKMVLFQSFHGKSYSCNPRAIYEQMIAENRAFKYIWVLNNLYQDIPGNPVIVRPHSFKYYYYMARAKYFVSNGNFPDFYNKRKNTVHIQTWHGTPLKKLGFDIDSNSPSYAENTSKALVRRNSRWDFLIGPNQYTSDILKRAFMYDKKMLDVGYPRNDLFYKQDNQEAIKNLKEKLNIPPDKKVILYAPTWRDYDFHSGNQHKPYQFKFDLDRFVEEFGDEYVLLLRLHYRDASRINLSGLDNHIFNVSSYNDIQELYLLSDVLITDYSSVMFDYANLKRPMIFFTYDLNRYGSVLRGFYMDFKKDAPGPLVRTEQQLFSSIRNIGQIHEQYDEKYSNFQRRFCHWENGQASKRVVEAVFDQISLDKEVGA